MNLGEPSTVAMQANVSGTSRDLPDEGGRTQLLSVIVPCKDEEAVLRETHRQLENVLQQLRYRF
jgi:hypothetical protein